MSTGDMISCLCTIFSTDHNCTQVLKTLTYYTLIAVENVHQKSFFDFLQVHLGVLNKNETHTDEMSQFGLGVSMPASRSAGLGFNSCQCRASKSSDWPQGPFGSGPKIMEVCRLEILLQYMKRDTNKLILLLLLLWIFSLTALSFPVRTITFG